MSKKFSFVSNALRAVGKQKMALRILRILPFVGIGFACAFAARGVILQRMVYSQMAFAVPVYDMTASL